MNLDKKFYLGHYRNGPLLDKLTIERRKWKMVNVYDVAEFILRKFGSMTAMKLQKLVYYCQAWSLVWDEKPLFPERIEAWANGPVVRELFDLDRKSVV